MSLPRALAYVIASEVALPEGGRCVGLRDSHRGKRSMETGGFVPCRRNCPERLHQERNSTRRALCTIQQKRCTEVAMKFICRVAGVSGMSRELSNVQLRQSGFKSRTSKRIKGWATAFNGSRFSQPVALPIRYAGCTCPRSPRYRD